MNNSLTKQVQVNIPYRMLKEGYLDKFLEYGLNPEIGFDAGALDTVSIPEANAIAEQLHQAGRTITLHGPFMDLSPVHRTRISKRFPGNDSISSLPWCRYSTPGPWFATPVMIIKDTGP